MRSDGGVLIHEYSTHVLGKDGRRWTARAYGKPRGREWIGWLAFVGDDGAELPTERETTQPDRRAVEYWAGGIEPIYLDGALRRALEPLPAR
ncbi:MAG TPA: hypothetical protein VKR80_01245 [Candidatus Limnocylindria bacterium]|nr:hypothetical protein [Candidatus Limnocylindria bacterium]